MCSWGGVTFSPNWGETLMVENTQESLEPEVKSLPGESSVEAGRHSLLEKLAEQTVLQAEALAQEITDSARQESEAEGIKVLAEYSEQAKAEAQQTIELAERRSETLINEAIAKAHAQSEDILGKARSKSKKILGKAQSEGREILSKAQSEGQEIMDRVRQEALAIINASQTRANSTESNARQPGSGRSSKSMTQLSWVLSYTLGDAKEPAKE